MTSLLHKNSILIASKIIGRSISCHTVSITKPHRLTYARTYPTLLVRSDGATFYIRFHEPRMIIKLPLDLRTLTEDEKRVRLENRKPKKRMTIVETSKVAFDPTKYIKKIKKQ